MDPPPPLLPRSATDVHGSQLSRDSLAVYY